MADPSIEDLARELQALREQVAGLIRPSQLDNSSVAYAPGTSFDLADISSAAVNADDALPGLSDLLAANEEALAAVSEDVAAAIAAAQEASDAGVAAGELANETADDALVKAQEALDAAAAAGGGATYSPNPPTADTPGVNRQQWFVWDSNYEITAYYVYDGDTSSWVQSAYTDAVIGNLDAGSITSGFLSAQRIAAASLTAAVLAADTITSREIGADAVIARNIKAAEITGDKIAARTIAAGNIQAGTITGNEIKANSLTAANIQAGSITANEINLDTLNGKTITGALIKSAASGNRLEMSGTVLAVYSANQTKPVGGIQATDDGDFSSIQILNSYSSLGVAGISLGVPRNPGAGSYESTRRLNAQITSGLKTPVLQANMLLSDRAASNAYPVFNHDATSSPIYVTADTFRLGSSAGTPVLFRDNLDVVVQANDFRMADGSSIGLGDTGWITVTSVGANYTVRSGYPLRYRRKNGIVYLNGQVYSKSGASAGGQGDLFTLPVGFRPPGPGDMFAPGVLPWDHYNQVTPGGVVSIFSNVVRTSSTGYPLDGLQFIAT